MNTEKFSYAMGELDSKYLDEAIAYRAGKTASVHFRRIPAALVAAMLATLLMGAGVAAAVYGDSIQNWFQHQWKEMTGQQMSEGQIEVIDHLTQEINVSQTIGDVTVTADSATVGDNTFFLLLRVEGLELPQNWNYGFADFEMEVTPSPTEEGNGIGSYGFEYEGLDGDGAALLLIDYHFANEGEKTEDVSPFGVSLWLKDFVNNAHTDRQETLAAGEWRLEFSLERMPLSDVISLPDTEAMVMDPARGEDVSVWLRDIELSSTGLYFECDRDDELVISDQISVVMKNGTVVDHDGGLGETSEENTVWSFKWEFPIDLEEVQSLQIGRTKIDIP
jgi:hypothetical protein